MSTDAPSGFAEFEFDLEGPLFQQIRETMDSVAPVPLSEKELANIPQRPGVYLLFHNGQVVYVGKADDRIQDRLRDHSWTIRGRRGLSLDDMQFKCVCFDHTWNPFKPEAELIAHYGTKRGGGWNGGGFGNHDPGIKRGTTKFKAGGFYSRYPLDDAWVCGSIGAGRYPALDLLKKVKDAVPFWFRFQGNRSGGEEEDRTRAEEARRDYDATVVEVPRDAMTARELLVLIACSLPGEWQATITPSHMLLYKEVSAVYPKMEVVWPVA